MLTERHEIHDIRASRRDLRSSSQRLARSVHVPIIFRCDGMSVDDLHHDGGSVPEGITIVMALDVGKPDNTHLCKCSE